MVERLRNLFDFQRFERNPGLQRHISAVEKKYKVGDILSDDALEMVSAGKCEFNIINKPDDNKEE
ncbi:MAG: hypothetical protein K5985_02555 [Lachnospiraceae bacterium]|nr:hypothetical protein [Lachnospiraceae bacterium]